MDIEKLNQLCAYLHAKNQLNSVRHRVMQRGYALRAGLNRALWKERVALLQRGSLSYSKVEMQKLMNAVPKWRNAQSIFFFEQRNHYPHQRFFVKDEQALNALVTENDNSSRCLQQKPNKKLDRLSAVEIRLLIKKNIVDRLNAEISIQEFTKQHRKEMAKLCKELGVRVMVSTGNFYVAVYSVDDTLMRNYVLENKKQIEDGAVLEALENMLME